MILSATRIEKSKNEDRTLITKTHELSDESLFDFRSRFFQLPVSEKQPTSGLRSKPEIEKLPLQNSFQVFPFCNPSNHLYVVRLMIFCSPSNHLFLLLSVAYLRGITS